MNLPNLSEFGLSGAAVAVCLGWGGLNYIWLGGEVGTRIVRAENLGACRAEVEHDVERRTSEAIHSVPKPDVNHAAEAEARRLKNLMNSPLGRIVMKDERWGLLPGMAHPEEILRQLEQRKQQAKRAYDSSIARIKAASKQAISGADDICGCLGTEAVDSTRSEWAIYSGSLGMVRDPKIKNMNAVMRRLRIDGACTDVG